MRIVTWNCRAGYLKKKKNELIEDLKPTIAVIQEAAPEGFDIWHGHYNKAGKAPKGIGIKCFDKDVSIRVCEKFLSDNRYFIPIILNTKQCTIKIVAVWAMGDERGEDGKTTQRGYRFRMHRMLDEMSDFIDERTIILGDFNSSVYFDYKYRSHKDKNFSAWNQRMTQFGFVSSLHEKLGVSLDESTLNTYFHNNHQAYCIDYAYMHKSMLEEQGVKSVITDERFRVVSDHIPLIIDFK